MSITHYRIDINLTGAGQQGANSALAKINTASPQTQMQSVSADEIKLKGRILGAYHTVKSFAVQQISHNISLVELRTGSKENQERENFYFSLVQQGLTIAETTIAGAAVGNLPGAVAGLVLSTAHTLLSYSNRQTTLLEASAVERQELQNNYIRAGARGSRGYNQ